MHGFHKVLQRNINEMIMMQAFLLSMNHTIKWK